MSLLLIGLGGFAGRGDALGFGAILPELDEMVDDGLITLEKVEVLVYRAGTTSGS